jgi:phosphotransferase system enzyme I (PtsI)
MTAGQIPTVKNVIRQMTKADAATILDQAMKFSSAEEIERFIKGEIDRRFHSGELTGSPRD